MMNTRESLEKSAEELTLARIEADIRRGRQMRSKAIGEAFQALGGVIGQAARRVVTGAKPRKTAPPRGARTV